MKLAKALEIIDGKPQGRYMVHFDVVDGIMVGGDYFPDKHGGESLIETEHEAWELARRFSLTAPDHMRMIYVVDEKFVPVPGYRERAYRNPKPTPRLQANGQPWDDRPGAINLVNT